MPKVALSYTHIPNISLSTNDSSRINDLLQESEHYDLEESDIVNVTFLSGTKKKMTVKQYLEHTHSIDYTTDPIIEFKPVD